jgi:hypothetical protein
MTQSFNNAADKAANTPHKAAIAVNRGPYDLFIGRGPYDLF